jgi:hypothetical protein
MAEKAKTGAGRPRATDPRVTLGFRLPKSLIYQLKAATERESGIRRKPITLSAYIEEVLQARILDLHAELGGVIEANAKVIEKEEREAAKAKKKAKVKNAKN